MLRCVACTLCQIKMQLRKKKYVFTTADATVQRLQKAYWKQVRAHGCVPHGSTLTPRGRISTHESEGALPCPRLRCSTAVPYRLL